MWIFSLLTGPADTDDTMLICTDDDFPMNEEEGAVSCSLIVDNSGCLRVTSGSADVHDLLPNEAEDELINSSSSTACAESGPTVSTESKHKRRRVTMHDINQSQFDVLQEEREKIREERQNLALQKIKFELEIKLLKRKLDELEE